MLTLRQDTILEMDKKKPQDALSCGLYAATPAH